MTAPSARGWRLGTAGLLWLAGCAANPAPVLREELTRVRGDLTRIEQIVQRHQGELHAERAAGDHRTGASLQDIHRSVARLSARLDELGRETAEVQGRLDDVRRRVDLLSLQLDVVGGPPGFDPGASPQAGTTTRGGRSLPPGATGAGAPPATTQAATPPAGAPAPLPETLPGIATPPSTAPLPGAPSPTGVASVAARAAQATDLYQAAYRDYTLGRYGLAIAGFREFLRLVSSPDLAEKAQYWIGESHFSLARSFQTRGERDRAVPEFQRAAEEFRRVLVLYPRGDRVPSALYKEALALLELGQTSVAESRLQYLAEHFPAAEEAAKAREDLARLRKR